MSAIIIRKHSIELQRKIENVTNDYLNIVEKVKKLNEVLFGTKKVEVSSFSLKTKTFCCRRPPVHCQHYDIFFGTSR